MWCKFGHLTFKISTQQSPRIPRLVPYALKTDPHTLNPKRLPLPLANWMLPILSDKMYLLISFRSQLPHKTVNLIFQSVIVINKLTIVGGS